ncbi:MAG: 3-hydroxyacyl-CoA dehydrogenase NAD-binding domain-containing protein [Pseudomonadota bacterium]|nr:3-hydroxyacyl-CoA dehydrogenase NAD-binding domain-containing protein [Pseudomonadota bacterium]
MNQTLSAYRTADEIKVVALVGAGSVGKSWAALYLAHGFEVIATDPAPGFEHELRRFVTDAWPVLRRLQPTAAATPPLHLLSIAASPTEAAKRGDLLHENAPENPQLKIRLIAELDAVMPPDRLILSSTGGIGATLLQSQCRFPGRVVVAHPFNPPHIIPLVEIVGGDATDPAAVSWTKTFLRGLGKRPIVLQREVVGHLANRLQAALLREAFHCLVEEVASAQDIDDAVRYGLGLRWALMGGLMTFHLAGGEGGAAHTLDLAGEAFERWWADLGELHLTAQVRAKIIAGTAELAGTRSIADWIRWRDEQLVGLVRGMDTGEPQS